MKQETIVVMDFGGQYNQLIARRVRECGVYCEIHSYKAPKEDILALQPKGIIFTGGPNSCYEEGAPKVWEEIYTLGIPILGICYGAQMMSYQLGGKVEKASSREYGKIEVEMDGKSPLFKHLPASSICWMSHNDYISSLAPGFEGTAHSASCPYAAAEDREKGLYLVQFHPEVLHTQYGKEILANFVLGICGCSGSWQMDAFIEESIEKIRSQVGEGTVLLGLSGGVDSSVAAALLSKAIGKRLTCVFVDHGLLRKDEEKQVEAVFGKDGPFDLCFVPVNARERFFAKLSGVTDPVEKRTIIGDEFVRVFEEESGKLGKINFLAQGTIYPDVVESGQGGESAVIKPHHNVGALPENIAFDSVVEPLRNLFKDEVRKVGLMLGLPESLIHRQPFPGPGLGVRIIGEV
ncbi:MAG: glutamine-hydrolyzing GMP synthase, partial [Blautia sp.]|nr:glutamine-hydrolyzing GMP synthase [Blautia sp.]